MYSQIVRVATTNNFNCTPAEWAQLWAFEQKNPDKLFFVNANIKTPGLSTLKNHRNRAVITANPDLTPPTAAQLKVLYSLDPDCVAFVRVKYLPENKAIDKLIEELAGRFLIVLTLQRFNGKKSLAKYTDFKHYRFECSRYRLAGEALRHVEGHSDDLSWSGKPVWICDRKGLGCQACGLCSKLTSGKDLPVYSLNLSSSGICPYNCPDCYAKTMQNFSRKIGHKVITYDKIFMNHKQAGRTEHIKREKEKCVK